MLQERRLDFGEEQPTDRNGKSNQQYDQRDTNVKITTMEGIEAKQLVWFGHVKRMTETLLVVLQVEMLLKRLV